MKEFWRNLKENTFGESGFVGRALLIFFVIALMIGAMVLSGPKPGDDFDPLATPTKSTIATQPSTSTTGRPLSGEYDLTRGVILAVTIVVIVIFIGAGVHLRLDHKKKNAKPNTDR